MKLFCLIFLFSLLLMQPVSGQQNRFIYLQTENGQPFYVRHNNDVYSSSNSGYVIIPKLKDGRYEFIIGFPRNEWPMQKVEYTVDKKDAGFILKNFGDKGWGLFNLQTLDVIMANAGESQKDKLPADDSFEGTLSQVVGADLSQPGRQPEQVIEKPAIAVEKNNDTVRTENVKVIEVNEPGTTGQPVNSGIEKLLSTSSPEGTDIVYIDRSGAKPDTIRIFIPSMAPAVAVIEEVKKEEPVKIAEEKSNSEDVKIEDEKVEDKVALPAKTKNEASAKPKKTKKAREKKNEPEFIEMELPVTDTVSKIKEDNVVAEPVPGNKTVIPNSNCKANADDKDFLKLRKNMASRKSAEDMVAVSRRDFRNRCYSVEQVKHLSALFLDDASKYMFFDAAYPSVHDFANFPSLVSELKDPYFINRFEAMIRK